MELLVARRGGVVAIAGFERLGLWIDRLPGRIAAPAAPMGALCVFLILQVPFADVGFRSFFLVLFFGNPAR